MIPEYTIYYGDGSTFQGAPEDAPNQNVQAIAWDDPTKGCQAVGRVVLHQWDIYIYSDDIGWHGTNKFSDLLQHLGKRIGVGGVRAVLTGRWIPKEAYDKIFELAQNGIKSATDPIREDGSE